MLMHLKFSPYLSSILHNSYTKSYELVEGLKTIPQKWIEDLKHVEYNELLSSSLDKLDDPIFDGPYEIYTPKRFSSKEKDKKKSKDEKLNKKNKVKK